MSLVKYFNKNYWIYFNYLLIGWLKIAGLLLVEPRLPCNQIKMKKTII